MNTASNDVHVDFNNADGEGYVRLNTVGAIHDLARLGISLSDGARLSVTDGEISVVGMIRKPGAEGVWRLEVDWEDIFRKHGELKQ